MLESIKEKLSARFSRGKHTSLIGLDLGTTVLKAVEVTLVDGAPVVTGVARRELLPGEEREAVLHEMFEAADFTARQVVTAVSGRSVVVRHLTSAPLTDEELVQAMRFEVGKYLPVEPSETALDCSRLRRLPQAEAGDDVDGEDRIGFTLAACRRAAIEEQVKIVQGLGLTPVAVDAEVFALVNAFELCNASTFPDDDEEDEGLEVTEVARASAETLVDPYGFGDDEDEDEDDDQVAMPGLYGAEPEEGAAPPRPGAAVAIADMGATRTQISVVVDGETCFCREIATGGNDLTQAVARRLGLDAEEAEEKKRIPGEHEAEVDEALESVIDDFVAELTVSLDFVEGHEGISVGYVLLTGGGSTARGLVEGVARGTGRRTRAWNLFESVAVDPLKVDVEELSDLGPALAVALGLAARVCAE